MIDAIHVRGANMDELESIKRQLSIIEHRLDVQDRRWDNISDAISNIITGLKAFRDREALRRDIPPLEILDVE